VAGAADVTSDGRGALVIREMTVEDGPRVIEIYGQGIATGNATLDGAPPDWRRWHATHRRECRFVASIADEVVGWTAISSWSSRDVYAGVAWESVYVADGARGGGVGRALLETLIPASEVAGVWTLIAGVQAENAASLALHEAVGFRRIGVHERLGRDPSGRWRDVVMFERRSRAVGV
jgi:L-amino acid N-acyltransferase YncA